MNYGPTSHYLNPHSVFICFPQCPFLFKDFECFTFFPFPVMCSEANDILANGV